MKSTIETTVGKSRRSTSKHSSYQGDPLKGNSKPSIFCKIQGALFRLAFFGSIIVPTVALGFTQSGIGIDFVGNAVPMGHEWITRLALLEIIGGDPIANKLKDPNDPRNHWTKGLAKNTNLSAPGAQREVQRIKSQPIKDPSYESGFKFVYDAILGERWVDIAGFNVTSGEAGEKLGLTDCWDVVAQEAVEVQYDHFMRRYDDRDGEGGVQAAQRSRKRFMDYFVAAAMATPGSMKAWDGGASTRYNKAVDRNYFLFGRAVHLFEDSFSSEHTVRIIQDNYEQIRQTKSYLCATGSEQHNHSKTAALTYKTGDVIWKAGSHSIKGWSSYVPSNMKTVALVAVEANKDLWAAFIRTMGTPLATREQKAQSEAQMLVKNWLHIDETEMLNWYAQESNRDDTYVLAKGQTGKGQTVAECMVRELKVKSGNQMAEVNTFARDRRTCLYNILPVGDSQVDRALLMPFNWKWRNKLYLSTPPQGWRPTGRSAPTMIGVSLPGGLLYSRETLGCCGWQRVTENNNVLMYYVMVMPDDGTLLGIGIDGWLYTRQTLWSPWTVVPNSGKVTSVTLMPDGTLLGIGTRGWLWTRPGIEGEWTLVPASGTVTSVTLMPDGTLLGIGTRGWLWTRPGIEGEWNVVDDSGVVTSVTFMEDGVVLRSALPSF